MQELGQVKTAKGRFVERKYLAILTAPLESSGTLIYIAPDRLEKHTLAPRAESLVLEHDQLTLESKEPNQRRTIRLAGLPGDLGFRREHPLDARRRPATAEPLLPRSRSKATSASGASC